MRTKRENHLLLSRSGLFKYGGRFKNSWFDCCFGEDGFVIVIHSVGMDCLNMDFEYFLWYFLVVFDRKIEEKEMDLGKSSFLCSRFSGINPLIGFEPSIFELSTFIRGKGKSE